MPPVSRRALLVVSLIALIVGCSTKPSQATVGTFTADISGSGNGNGSFKATANTISVTASPGIPGGMVIFGTQISGTNLTTLTFTLGYITGKGTYPLGVSFTDVSGGIGAVQAASTSNPQGTTQWQTSTTGAGGQFVITDVTSSSIAGTFEFTGTPAPVAGGTGTKTVSNGVFNLALPTGFSFAADMGSSLTGTFGSFGSQTMAAFIGNYLGGTIINVIAVNDTMSVNLGTSINVAAGTSYPFTASGSGLNSISVGVTQGSSTWGTGTGTVMMSTVTPTRFSGNFNGTLTGPSSMAVNGQFSIRVK